MQPSIFINNVFYSAFDSEIKRNVARAKLVNRGMVKSSAIAFKMYNTATGDMI